MQAHAMQRWEYTSVKVAPGQSWYDVLRRFGDEGWEAWHMERAEHGLHEIYFKRPHWAAPINVTGS